MSHTKDITIKDMNNQLRFRIRLFGAEEGLDFLDKVIDAYKGGLSIKPFLGDLLPLASMLDVAGKQVVKDSLTPEDCYALMQNPLAIIELGVEILKFQEVFMKDSKVFQGLMGKVGNIWNTPTSESATL